MLLRQTEGFMGLAILIHIAEIRLAIKTVVALRGKDKPSAVTAPRVVGVALVAVYYLQGIYATSPEIHHLKMCLWMPDGEGTVVAEGEHQVFPVEGRLRE